MVIKSERDNVVEFATDQRGSRFVQQKLEIASAEYKASVLKQVLTDPQLSMTDVFGNCVVQKLLDHGKAACQVYQRHNRPFCMSTTM